MRSESVPTRRCHADAALVENPVQTPYKPSPYRAPRPEGVTRQDAQVTEGAG